MAAERVERLEPVGRSAHAVPARLEDELDDLPDVGIVVDDADVSVPFVHVLRHGPLKGNLTVNFEPTPSSLSTPSSPWCASTIVLVM